MLEQLKKKNVIIFAIILILIPLAITVGQYCIISFTTWFPSLTALTVAGLLYFFAILEFLVGFVIGDFYVSKYRRASKNWANALPADKKAELWHKRSALWASAFVIFVIAFVFDMISLF